MTKDGEAPRDAQELVPGTGVSIWGLTVGLSPREDSIELSTSSLLSDPLFIHPKAVDVHRDPVKITVSLKSWTLKVIPKHLPHRHLPSCTRLSSFPPLFSGIQRAFSEIVSV